MRTLTLPLILILAITACAVDDDGPTDEELADLDAWATTADGKADLPPALSGAIAWLRDVYENQMSAVWHGQEHPATASAAIQRIHGLVRSAGIADPTRRLYRAAVRRLRAEHLDHSEINIALPDGTVIRLVGDPKGAGVFVDDAPFAANVGPPLCLTWAELELAVTTSYVPGAYAIDYVCHTITERVLRALDVGTARFSGQVRTYPSARWIWGPVLPSGNSHDPSDWSVSRSCGT